MKTGIKFIPEFHVNQRISSKSVLEALHQYWNCGYIKENHARNIHDKTLVFVVRNRDDLLKIIIPFFENYQLKTEKQGDFKLFSRIVKLMHAGEHRKISGAKKILSLAYKMNQAGRYRRYKHNIT
jgi:hypothetical protein